MKLFKGRSSSGYAFSWVFVKSLGGACGTATVVDVMYMQGNMNASWVYSAHRQAACAAMTVSGFSGKPQSDKVGRARWSACHG
jgi:hypothetical protein